MESVAIEILSLIHRSGRSRIFMKGHQLPKWDYFATFCSNFMKMKEFGPPGCACPWHPLGCANIWSRCLTMKYATMMLPGPFEYISEKGSSQKIKVFLTKKQQLPPFQFHFRRAGLQAIWANLIGPITHLGRCYRTLNVRVPLFGNICEGSSFKM